MIDRVILKNCNDLYLHGLGKYISKKIIPRKTKIGKSDRLLYYWCKDQRQISIGDLMKIASIRDFSILINKVRKMSAYASPHIINIPTNYNKDLAYLAGYHMGDGSIARNSFTIQYMDSKEQLIRISKIYQKLFGISLTIVKNYRDNAYDGYITSKALAMFLHLCLRIPIGVKKRIFFPDWVHNSIKKDFVVGFMDAEFGVIKKKFQFSGCSVDREFIERLQIELSDLGLNLKFYGPYSSYGDKNPRWFLKSSRIEVMYKLLEKDFIRHPNHLNTLMFHIEKRAPVV